MITRNQATVLKNRSKSYPVVTLTGPRQSGKSTLCKQVFPEHSYVNLEDLTAREFATTDPTGFLQQHKGPVIFDEIQRVPQLTSQIQVIVDEQKKNGQYILTGSQNFSLMHSISQSLVGRTSLLTLLPLTIDEVRRFGPLPSLNQLLQSGFYPKIYDQHLEAAVLMSDYIATYLERDLRQLQNIKDLSLFQKFLGLCAGRVGQLLNLTNLANEVGVTSSTLKHWLSALEASYIVYLLKPYHQNINKRLVKTPKLYFYDTGLAAFLLGIHKPEQMQNHPLRGALFENMVVMEFIKNNLNQGRFEQFYFYRDKIGNEVDLIVDKGTALTAVEIKSAQTPSEHLFSGLQQFAKNLPPHSPVENKVVYGGDITQTRTAGELIPYFKL